ncbi:hypothetical protein NSP21_24390, partial [Salmonella enterica]|nr:hypothetical protein [Salmonella enterica]
MTETTAEMTREELEAELARRNAPEQTPTPPTTRELSPAKPQDHKPADAEKLTLNYKGVTYEFRKKDL